MLAVTGSLVGCTSEGTSSCSGDVLSTRTLGELDSFATWVRKNGVQGAIGEVGWPKGAEADRWNALAQRWYGAADDAKLGVFAWSAAERWSVDYPLGIYRQQASGQPGFLAESQAPVVERHLDQSDTRGVALADATFGATFDGDGTYSNARPGTFETDYTYPSAAFLQFLAGRGIRAVRLSFTWERLQPALGGPLNPAELGRLRGVLAAAAAAGLSVNLDLHNYGRYVQGSPDGNRRVLLLGSPELPDAALADVWSRLTREVGTDAAVSGYGLMNEPHDLPGGAAGWEAASVTAARAIRAIDGRTAIYVGGYAHSGVSTWTSQHARAWVEPALWPVVYEAHQYFDVTHEGVYAASYEKTSSDLRAACSS